MRRTCIIKTAVLIGYILLCASSAQSAGFLDYPHKYDGCSDCHLGHHSGEPSLLPAFSCTSIDDTQHNNLCKSCHEGSTAPLVMTHSSIQTDDGYGDWSVECRTCHHPHEQMQFRIYGADSHLYSEQSDNIQPDTPLAGQSRLTDSEASWTDDEYVGYILVANVNDSTSGYRGYGYKVLGNTATTLTVDGNIDTAKAPIGSTFAIIYGRIIREQVTLDDILRYCGQSTSVPDQNTLIESGAGWTPGQFAGLTLIPNTVHPDSKYTVQGNTSDTITTLQPMDMGRIEIGRDFKIVGIKTGDKTVKFYDKTGTNSFADGDTTYDGICQVCHTQTDHFRNDGSGPDPNHTSQGPSVPGSDCTSCHSHVEGFKGTGDCMGCHNTARTGVYNPRQITGAGGDFVRLSRHVSNGTATEIVTNQDCAICHAEGDVAKINAGTGYTSAVHNDNATSTTRMVNLRDVDNYAGATYNFNKNTVDETMRTNMDSFCLGCHDSDGASDIAINSGDDTLIDTGVNVSSAEALAPFNSNDNLRNGRDGFTTRTRVVDVASQFYEGTGGTGAGYNGNASQHAVLGGRYSTTNANWLATTWNQTHTYRDGTDAATVRETATLHCSDCHLSESNAHGAQNAWHMLLNGTADDFTTDQVMTGASLQTAANVVCYKCHAIRFYQTGLAKADETQGSRINHGIDAKWDLGQYGGGGGTDGALLGPGCLLCHAGNEFGGIHGRDGTYDPDNFNDDQATGTRYTKYRFMPGAYMRWSPGGGTASTPAGTDTDWTTTTNDGTCYFPDAATRAVWSTCSSHDGSPGTKNDNKVAQNYGRPLAY